MRYFLSLVKCALLFMLFSGISIAWADSYRDGLEERGSSEESIQVDQQSLQFPNNITTRSDRDAAWSGFVSLGVGAVPEFDGAQDFQPIPLVSGRLTHRSQRWLQIQGLELSANLIPSRRFNAGPVMQFRFGRDSDIDNPIIANLAEIDETVELGGFMSYSWLDNLKRGDAITVRGELVQDAFDGHGGFLGDLSLSYTYPFSRRLIVAVSGSASFGVDTFDSARTGLPVYQANAGFRNVGIGTRVIYAFSPAWGVVGLANYSYLLDDAGNSPVVQVGGLRGQLFFGGGVFFRF